MELRVSLSRSKPYNSGAIQVQDLVIQHRYYIPRVSIWLWFDMEARLL